MRLLPIIIAAFLFAGFAHAAERIDLTAPDQVRSGTSSYQIVSVHFEWDRGRIEINLVGENGETKSIAYDDPEGRALMVAMNRMDFSSVSLQRRIMNKLLADGHLVGAVSGIPDTE